MINVHVKSKQYSKSSPQIIQDISLCLKQGEIVSLIGPSGAGKTTLLNIISGLDCNYSGSLSFESPKDKRLNTSFIFQEPRLMPWLTVLDNVMLVADDLLEDAEEKALCLLEMLDMKKMINSYPRQLSGGMQRRVSLARAFMPNSRLLLMDEPFVSLDKPLAQKLRSDFIHLWNEAKPSVVFVTHDLNEAISMSDRIVFLSKSPAKILHEQAIDLDRPIAIDAEEVTAISDQLLLKHPRLLLGDYEWS